MPDNWYYKGKIFGLTGIAIPQQSKTDSLYTILNTENENENEKEKVNRLNQLSYLYQFDGSQAPAGVYFIRLELESELLIGKMIIEK
ncbi:MAG: hypothetical protein ABFS38_11440 [Bacteroidota bacterium]